MGLWVHVWGLPVLRAPESGLHGHGLRTALGLVWDCLAKSMLGCGILSRRFMP